MSWLATKPTTWPPFRAGAVIRLRPKRSLTWKISPPSASRRSTRVMSWARLRASGTGSAMVAISAPEPAGTSAAGGARRLWEGR
jgi:hypothetical protein